MRVLVLESCTGIAGPTTDALEQAGHTVVRCTDDPHDAFPCKGIDHLEQCPLEGAGADVAVLIRDPLAERPTGRESGVNCALRARIPVLQNEAIPGRPSPFDGYVEVFDGDVVQAVEAAVAAPSAGHAAAVKDHLLGMEAFATCTPDELGVVAHRTGGRLLVEVSVPARLGPSAKEAVAGWAVGAARRYDRTLAVIDVAVDQR